MTGVQTRNIGGEAGRRGFFGGTSNKTRTVALVIVGVVGAFLTVYTQGPGLLATIAAAGLVWVLTLRTHRGSLFLRLTNARRWRERQRLGIVSFAPIARHPLGWYETPSVSGEGKLSRKERKAQEREERRYRETPDGVDGFHWLQHQDGLPGIAWHVPAGEDAWLSVCFSVDGQVQGIASDAFLDNAMQAFGGVLNRFGNVATLPNRLQSLTRVLPVDSARHEAWVWEHLDPTIAEDDTAMMGLVASYDEVVQLVRSFGLMQRHYVVIRWPITPAFVKAASRRGPAQDGWRSLMNAEIATVSAQLRRVRPGNTPQEVSTLSARHLAAVLRHMQNPSWSLDDLEDLHVEAPWEPSEDVLSANVVTSPGPDGVEQQWWHRTAELPIDAFETGPRTSLWVAPLLSQLGAPIVRTLSLQVEVVPAAIARSAALADLTADLADLAAQRRKGSIDDSELAARSAAARARLADLAVGTGYHGVGWAGHLTVSGRNREELTDAVDTVSAAAGDAGIARLQWLDGQQAAAQAATWPLTRGMAPLSRSGAVRLQDLLAGTGSKEAIS